MVIFVGDKPSSKNINPDIPFVGTKSYKTLLDMIEGFDMYPPPNPLISGHAGIDALEWEPENEKK